MPRAKKFKPIVPHHPKGGTGSSLKGVTKQLARKRPKKNSDGAHAPEKQLSAHASRTGKPSGLGKVIHKIRAYSRNNIEEGRVTVLRCANIADRQAAWAVKALVTGDAQGTHIHSIKSLTLAPHITAKKATHAIVCQAMKFYLVLTELIKRTGLVESISGHQHKDSFGAGIPVASSDGGPPTKVLCPFNMLIIVYELLLGQGLHSSGGGRGPAERVVLKYKDTLKAELLKMMNERGAADAQGLLPKGGGSFRGAPHPRSVRVNPLRAGRTVEAVLQMLHSKALPQEWEGVSRATHEKCWQASVDPLLPDVLLLPPGTDMHDHPLVQEGSLVLQSRASCMPAHALRPQPGWTCVDCCAAPGNKTTHVAALMQGRGRVIAFDKDAHRLQRLRDTAKRAGVAGMIDARCQDVLSLDPTAPEFAEVQGVILDPSCSGSGTVFTRMDHLLPSFQRRHLQQQQQQHGEGHMPQGNDDSGSGTGTCSESGGTDTGSDGGGSSSEASSAEEEEETDHPDQGGQGGSADAHASNTSGTGRLPGCDGGDGDAGRIRHLARFQVRALRHALRFPALQRLVYSTCSVHKEENEEVVGAVLEEAHAAGLLLVDPFPSWPHRGLPLFPGCEKLVRTDAFRDGTDGFFVAVFARVEQ